MIWPFSRRPAPATRFELSASGRPIRPVFSQFHQIEDAPQKDRALALEWATAWLGLQGIDHHTAAGFLDRLLASDLKANDGSLAAKVAEVAKQALFTAKEEFATTRTARTLPNVIFEQACCDVSLPYQGMVLAAAERPRLPLPDCTADLCGCRIQQISRAEYRRLSEGHQ